MKPYVALAVSCLLLGGCATSADSRRARLVVPSDVGALYSDVEMQTKLAFAPEAACAADDCAAIAAFRNRVRQLTTRIIPGAQRVASAERIAIPNISLQLPGKHDIGTLSSASGTVAVFDGLRVLELSDPALAFVIAREMGHVVGKHHEENTATGLAVSVTVAVLFPLAGVLQGVEAAYAASTLASTATSFAGARVVRAMYEDDQRREADAYALAMLTHAGWTTHEVADALRAARPRLIGEGWLAELRDSQRWLDTVAPASVVEVPPPLPEAFVGPVFPAWLVGPAPLPAPMASVTFAMPRAQLKLKLPQQVLKKPGLKPKKSAKRPVRKRARLR